MELNHAIVINDDITTSVFKVLVVYQYTIVYTFTMLSIMG